MKKTLFEKLMGKAEKYLIKALKSNNDRIRFHYQDKADFYKNAAYSLTLDQATRIR